MPTVLFLFIILLGCQTTKAYISANIRPAPLLLGCNTRHGNKPHSQHHHTMRKTHVSSSKLIICKSHGGDDDVDDIKDVQNCSNADDKSQEANEDFHGIYKEDDTSNRDEEEKKFLNEIAWRTEKIRLEEANTRSFLKRRPRKLPYEDARRWVQANLGPDTEDEFYDLVENGNLRTPYIPKRPEEYYTQSGSWISWEHFLRVSVFEEDKKNEVEKDSDDLLSSSSLPPDIGIFD